MKKAFFVSTSLLASLSFGGAASACDMHGGGFGFGMKDASWQSYSPRSSTIDPAFADDERLTPINTYGAPLEKAKPSFSNAANLAALKAKTLMAMKDKAKSSETSDEKASVKKASLNADR